jgi:hypothetical protein
MSFFASDCTNHSPFFQCGDDVRFTNKENTQKEIENLFKDWFEEQLKLYGQKVSYYVNQTTVSAVDPLYGESNSGYAAPKAIIILVELNESAPMLSQFGLMADDDLTCFVTISSFYNVFGNGSEPKSGDLLELSEFGSDRPGGRTGRIFQITQRIDEDVTRINPLMGHYLWIIKAKRFDFTFEPNSPKEGRSDQVIDDTFTGTFTGVSAVTTGNYNPSTSIDEESRRIFDHNNLGNKDSVYGDY